MKLLFGGFRSIKEKGKKQTNTAALWIAWTRLLITLEGGND